jgi:PAS domain S-box-containing protein
MNRATIRENIAAVGLMAGIGATSAYSYLLFHGLVEVFSIAVAWGIFFLAWNTRRIMDNAYLLFLGMGYFFIGLFDLLHTLSYKGVNTFPGYDSGLAIQLWIASRYLEAATLVAAPLLMNRRLEPGLVLAGFALVSASLLGAIFTGVFPEAFVDGVGLTRFKTVSEYVISAMLLVGGGLLYRERERFDPGVRRLLLAAVAVTVAGELVFTMYVTLYSLPNVIGHFFKIISFYLIYKALLETGIRRPFDVLFRDLRLSREALAESEAWYRELVEGSSSAILRLDGHGRITFANDHARRLFGYRPGELTGSLASETITPARDSLGRDQRPLFHKAREDPENAGHFEAEHVALDGRRLWLSWSVRPLTGDGEGRLGLLCVGIDITARRRAEQEVEKLIRAVEQSVASIVITDREGAIEYVNPFFARLTGYDQAEVMGANPRILKSGHHDEAFYREMWATLTAGRTWTGEIRNRRKDGTLFWESASITPVKDEEGRITHYIGVKEDITEKKRLERLKEDVERMSRHDLKTPLNAVINLPRLMLSEDHLSGEHREMLEMIRQSGMAMLTMINTSLNLYKMETGTYDLEPESVDLAGVLVRLVTEAEASHPGVAGRVRLDGRGLRPGEEFLVLGEELLCHTMFSHLVANAFEASEPGDTVTVDLARHRERARVEIANPAVIDPRIRERLFTKYATWGKKGGTGLGLYTARLVARTHGGRVDLISTPSCGTTVTVDMPAAPEEDGAHQGAVSSPEPEQRSEP